MDELNNTVPVKISHTFGEKINNLSISLIIVWVTLRLCYSLGLLHLLYGCLGLDIEIITMFFDPATILTSITALQATVALPDKSIRPNDVE